MSDIVYELFISSLKKIPREDKDKGLVIESVNFETFKLSTINDSTITLREMLHIHEWMGETLRTRAHQVNFLRSYHTESPHFWMNDIGEQDDNGYYIVGLDLEDFMESSHRKSQKKMIAATGSFIPDNYELSKKVYAAFKRTHKSKSLVENISYRDTAMWKSKDPHIIEALGRFIQSKYIDPVMTNVMKSCAAKGVVFKNNELEFVY
jgi:hypothetical protein